MIEYRLAHPEERDAYVAFADMVFQGTGTDIHFATSLPKVYAPEVDSAWMQHVAVDDVLGIRGLVAVLPNQLHLGNAVLKTGYIGTVSVHPDARGEGHMKALMAQALQDMRARHTDVAILGGQRQRYAYFGYAPSGVHYEFSASSRNIRHALKDVDAASIRFEEILPDSDLETKAQALHEARPNRFDRNQPGFAIVCRSYYAHPYAILSGEDVIGFMVTNTDGKLIEDVCVPDVHALDQAIKAWMTLREFTAVRILMPEWEQAFICHLNTWAEYVSYSVGQLVRILNYPRTVKALLDVKSQYTHLEDGELSLNCEGQSFTLRVQNNKVEVTEGAENPLVLDTLDAGKLFLTPFGYEGRPPVPPSWFPLPLYAPVPDTF